MSERASLFFGGLPSMFTTEQLKGICAKHGEVLDGEVFLDEDGMSRGFGIVTMQSTGAAVSVKAALDATSIPGIAQGRSIKVRWALNTRTLYVKDLGPDVSTAHLHEVAGCEALAYYFPAINARLFIVPGVPAVWKRDKL